VLRAGRDAALRLTASWRLGSEVVRAVKTTGIYCRSDCPARAPKPENVRLMASVETAREAGFRACKRCHPDAAPGGPGLVVALRCREPFDAEGLLAFLAMRAVPGVEEAIGGGYRRSLRLPHGAGIVELHAREGRVEVRFWLESWRDLRAATERTRALLDLDTDPLAVAEVLGADPLLAPLVEAVPGRRVPGHPDPHELAARAVLGQQVSIAGAATLAGRLTARYGEKLERPLGAVTHLFPSAAALAQVDPDDLAMPRARRRALIGLASALASGELRLDARVDRAKARERMLALPGIGPWTADYVAMRALGEADAFLPSDLGVRHALEGLGEGASPAAAERIAERWRPYRAYALQHLWASLAAPRVARPAPLAAAG
jgi:AraC family transcriptional regulator, regulatory protein of adaptative response / DNA-3-methyladenine glycosylase II